MDLKDGKYTKENFVSSLDIQPTYIIDSGNGVHAYWQVEDLNAENFLRLQRRLCRKYKTDEAVCKIYQLMRVPDTYNTKEEGNPKLCEQIAESNLVYRCEEFDKLLPFITLGDEEYCRQHYDKTYNTNKQNIKIEDTIPLKFAELINSNREVKDIWIGGVDDRSKADWRLGHIMFGSGFTKAEALAVLVNTAKALERAPTHRVSYASNIVDKIWIFELEENLGLTLSSSVREILQKAGNTIKGTRFPCWNYLDATNHGFRLSQVIGLVAGSGVGKTAMALNMFQGFVQNNPDFDHFFIPLEQPSHEIADRWKTMCGTKTHLYDKVHVISNYDDSGAYRNLSLSEIKDYILKFQKVTGKKVGCIVIDHIGALKKKDKKGENQDLMDICHEMKAFAVETNTMLVMQSQAPREKAGIGDLELNKDAAYGTVYFESYCDYLVTIWQPLKRCYSEQKCPTVTAFKFCKIRHKKKHLDNIQEDVCHYLYFDPENEYLRPLTQDEEIAFDFYVKKATNLRKNDRKTDLVPYKSMHWVNNGQNSNNSN